MTPLAAVAPHAVSTQAERSHPSLVSRSSAELWALILTTLTGVTWCDWGTPRRVVRSLERLGIRPPWLDHLTERDGTGSGE
jgi:hypothetical protein